MLRVSVVGGSGYVGGEALRLLLGHPEMEVVQVTSESNAGKPVFVTHPNLRGTTDLRFSSIADLEPVDCMFLALPHGESQRRIDELSTHASMILDLAADFRLHDPQLYQRFYGEEHHCPERLNEFVYSIPELHRERIRSARMLSGAGCIATCTITSLYPLFAAGVVRDQTAFVDAKVASSAAGAKANPGSHHPERAGCLRSFKPTAHRHTAEITENLTVADATPHVHLSATSTDSVRGILTTSQLFLKDNLSEIDIRGIYREHYGREPFVRIIKERRGIFRYPEPKLLAGTNFVDIGFELEPDTGRLVVLGAIDNLVKGSAGNVIQGLNIINGWDERTGLAFPGLHPV
ncbi:MAG: N-acetyl-gamma-glutamyl-phosphate reductase [Bdellovibrionales bacterium]|nr:N-acetyl-gamma-glutamyl-phosphate reductase [Bdellovibrionales bacterium]